jgi:hypothetical protein
MTPTYDGPRPEPAADGYASVTHTIQIDNVSPERVRAWNDSRSLADIVRFDNFPAVAETEPLIGDWVPGERVGNRRRVRFTDGSYLAEEVLDDSPERFRYVVWGFTSRQRLFIRHGLAEFRFVAHDGGTRLEWTYSFLPKLAALRPRVQEFLTGVMTPMMTATLRAMRDGINPEL